MEYSTILLCRLKKSLKSVGIFYFIFLIFLFVTRFVISLFFSPGFSENPLFSVLIFFCIFMGIQEVRDYKLFSQFNISRKRHFLISCLQMLSLSLIIAFIQLILIKVFSLGSGGYYAVDLYTPYFRTPTMASIALFFLMFLVFTLAGSIGLLISYLYMKFSRIFLIAFLFGILITFLSFSSYFVANIEEDIILEFGLKVIWILGFTEDGINPVRPLGILFILSLINLGTSKLVCSTVDIKKIA